MSPRAIVHIALHGLVPLAVAWTVWRPRWLPAFAAMMAGMLIDLDHLLATPVFDPDRCSVGFHPLHTAPAVGVYIVLAAIPRTRYFGVGLLIHIALDLVDCAVMRG